MGKGEDAVINPVAAIEAVARRYEKWRNRELAKKRGR